MRGERGAALPEYALVLAILTVGTVGAIDSVQAGGQDLYEEADNNIGPLPTHTIVAPTTTSAPIVTTAPPAVTTTTAPPPTTTTTVPPPTTTTTPPEEPLECETVGKGKDAHEECAVEAGDFKVSGTSDVTGKNKWTATVVFTLGDPLPSWFTNITLKGSWKPNGASSVTSCTAKGECTTTVTGLDTKKDQATFTVDHFLSGDRWLVPDKPLVITVDAPD